MARDNKIPKWMFLKLGSIGTPFSHKMMLGILWREGGGGKELQSNN